MAGPAPARLAEVLARVVPFADCWIAFSGGLDSTALLHAALAQRESLPGRLRAVHVDHGLQAGSSDWAAHCLAVCAALDVPLVVRRLDLRLGRGESLEAVARESRYRAMLSLLDAGDLLLTAHHREDQAETLLLALLRGSGVSGLAAMPTVSARGGGRLVRPFLELPRAVLEEYVSGLGGAWVEDPSNQAWHLDRNYLRHAVMPMLRARWPAADATLARSAGHCAEADAIIEEVADGLLAECAGARPGTLGIGRLLGLSRPRRKAVLRLWLRRQGRGAPDARQLERILDEVLTARADADPLVAWTGCEVRRHRDDLFALSPLPPAPAGLTIRWSPVQGDPVLRLPQGLGRLCWPAARRGGEPRPSLIEVGFGPIAQVCRSHPRRPRRSLKRLFQEAGIPVWLRPYVPLLLVDGQLLAVAGVCACASGEGEHPGVDVPLWVGHPWEALALFRDEE
ncbi:MAG: tRNA lysidine(34) synthetase TilS [Sphingobacteriia bacterium]|nr:tRNA lysidine(34) synthetase TilS [Sphingobacteriia bacterium]NCC41115.1 tRNA lysidine(34) synthetase TilS [Gammaproteobacteria bacterium]